LVLRQAQDARNILEVFLDGFQPACGTSPGVRPSLLDDLQSSLAIVMNDPG